ncbi:hypothetical protein [Desulfobacca acetoxidans]|uniref:Uncharacterized protein n=1 Tax=Desulfobacca acetoxidans (strain ATCC 700848 / DSM 11109 / ASRB2) TaxID=880072 RepID=F2NDY8_DESAR|nr:hypothetical protein [Desulfobacca acetoxidans]AEB10556.1 hypothetical protein Desac_2743 [Desulfobacca acetoxidans DSM 11109]
MLAAQAYYRVQNLFPRQLIAVIFISAYLGGAISLERSIWLSTTASTVDSVKEEEVSDRSQLGIPVYREPDHLKFSSECILAAFDGYISDRVAVLILFNNNII